MAASAAPAKKKRYRKGSLLNRKRGVDPRRTGRQYMRDLQAKRHATARRKDRDAYDRFWAETLLRLFPS